MSTEITTEYEMLSAKVVAWEPPTPPTNLVIGDGDPLETNPPR